MSFRKKYLSYDEITAVLKDWEKKHPKLVRLRSIGKSGEGRDLWVATIGPDPDRARPSVWIDGNMHASEVCGSSVALAIAEDVIAMHAGGGTVAPALRETLKDVLFHVMPRISPDGAECVLKTGRYVRSNPREARLNRNHARWRCEDVDGDGRIHLMRRRDPAGELVESRECPGVLVARTIDDEGPFYKVFPEGVIENFDGFNVPTPGFYSDNQVDMNRNFPYFWAPEPDQQGAGAFPLSEPESRAVVEFTSKHPELFAWLNLHTFGGVFIRPHGALSDAKMDQSDLALFRQIGEWGRELTGYPMVSGYEEFTYEPDKPLRGDLTDYAYHLRGCIAYVVELWDLFEKLGTEKRGKRFVDRYNFVSREEVLKLARWDREKNSSRIFIPWKKVQHPQLGEVEVGGVDPRVGLHNPPYEEIEAVCVAQSAMFLRVAAMAPRLRVNARKTALDGGATRVDVTVENLGYLPTFVLESARKIDWNEPVWAELEAQGCKLASDARREVGHLDGWGRGLYEGSDTPYFMRSRGTTGSRVLSWVVHGKGVLRVRAGSCRTGWASTTVEI